MFWLVEFDEEDEEDEDEDEAVGKRSVVDAAEGDVADDATLLVTVDMTAVSVPSAIWTDTTPFSCQIRRFTRGPAWMSTANTLVCRL